mgnify:FL=1
MREQLAQYVDLLFAGSDGAEKIKQEILQNTLDRFDDLVSRGSTEEAAYRQAIAGIGDVGELLGGESPDARPQPEIVDPLPGFEGTAPAVARMMRAVAIFLYIVSPIPLLLLDTLGWDNIGMCLTLVIVAIATLLLLTFKAPAGKKSAQDSQQAAGTAEGRKNLGVSIKSLMRTLGVVLYFVISFSTGAWLVTWLIFPIEKALEGVVCAGLDLREGK